MEKRHSTLFSNIAFKSSLLLDPRFKNTLNKKDQEEIIEHLVQLYERLMNLKPEDNEAGKLSVKIFGERDSRTRKDLYIIF